MRQRLPLFLLPLLIVFSSCENDPADIVALERKMDPGVEIADSIRMIYSDSAQIKVTIEGPILLNHLDKLDPRQEFPRGLFVTFFGPQQDTTSTLEARWGVYRERENEVVVRDSVVWRGNEGEKLETEELIWDEAREKIYTKKFVVITRPESIIYGYGFEADQDFSNARVLSVEGRLPVDRPE